MNDFEIHYERPPSKRPAPTVLAGPARPPTPWEARMSEGGLADRFVEQHGQDFAWTPAWGWLSWDGRRWAKEGKEAPRARAAAHATVRTLYGEAERTDDPEARELLVKFARRSDSSRSIAGLLRMAEPALCRDTGDFDARPWHFNVSNGTINLQTGDLRPHRREDLITRLAPHDFDPEADTSAWERFISEIMAEDELLPEARLMTAYLQRAIGYTLSGMTGEQCLFFCYGPSSENGKSTLLEALRAMMGDYATTARLEAFMESKHASGGNTPEIAALVGARLVVSSETGDGTSRRLDIGLVKTLTGDEAISACAKYEAPFNFKPTMKLWWAANHRPTIRDTTRAAWRRLKLIPFERCFPKNEGFKAALLSEATMRGALAWAVQGCLAWQQGPNGRPDLVDPPKVTSATNSYREDMDLVGGFLAECLGPGLSIDSADAYEMFQVWAHDNGEATIGQRAFGLQLRERGFEPDRGGRGRRRWLGLDLTDEARQRLIRARQAKDRTKGE